jgi:hypothetical protein
MNDIQGNNFAKLYRTPNLIPFAILKDVFVITFALLNSTLKIIKNNNSTLL